MNTDAKLPDEPMPDNRGEPPVPPEVAADGGSGDSWFDARAEWAFYGFVLGAAYVFAMWILSDWVLGHHRK